MKFLTACSIAIAAVSSISAVAAVPDVELVERNNDRCRHPRVRKEWRTLSKKQKKDYISALKCLTKAPIFPGEFRNDGFSSAIPRNTTGTSYYDDLVYMHMDQSNQMHFNAIFLPWHRYFLWIHEKALGDFCGYKGPYPYYDWTQDFDDLASSAVFSPDPEIGFGGDGDPAQGGRVTDGAFTDTLFAYPYPHTVRRHFDMYPREAQGDPTPVNIELTPEYIRSVIHGSAGDYEEMNIRLARNWPSAHDAIHFYFGGDLFGQCPDSGTCPTSGTEWTPNEPLFWMHHAFVDRVWTKWQEKRPQNQWSYGGPLNGVLNPSPPLGEGTLDTVLKFNNVFPDLKIKEIIKTTNKHLCYEYD